MKWRSILCLVALVLVVGCAEIADSEIPPTGFLRLEKVLPQDGLFRRVDCEAGVVLYVYGGSFGTGLTAVPLGQTNLTCPGG